MASRTKTVPATVTAPALTISPAARYDTHPDADLLPPMDAVMLAALTENIRADGQLTDIVLHEGKILDGRARYTVCIKLGIQPRFRDFDPLSDGEDPVRFVVKSNLIRKHWQPGQLSMIAANLVTSRLGSNQRSQNLTIVAAAHLVGLNRRSVERALEIQKHSPNLASAIAGGKLSIGLAKKLSALPGKTQKSILALPCDKKSLKKEIDTAIKATRRTRPVQIPEGQFNVIVSDPRWAVDRTPYATMTVEEIDSFHRTELGEKAVDDCLHGQRRHSCPPRWS